MDGCYVYQYIDEFGDIVYVGQGVGGRAWFCGNMQGDTKERQKWKAEQLKKGRLPCDWVVISHRCLQKDEARSIETELIKEHQPLLNRLHTKHYNPSFKKWTDKHTSLAKGLREEGMGYENIGKVLGLGAMTVWRNLNEK
jgi:excinuclease UvrABC nuclease subunit